MLPHDLALVNRGHRFRPIIQHAIWLYLRFTLSYLDVEDLLKSFGWGIAALYRLNAATKLPSLRGPPHRIFKFR